MDPYEILGISPHASAEEAKRAFHRLAHKHHPDKGGNAEAFKRISAAYAQVRDRAAPGPADSNDSYDFSVYYTYGGRTTSSVDEMYRYYREDMERRLAEMRQKKDQMRDYLRKKMGL